MDIKIILITSLFLTAPVLAKEALNNKQYNLESFALSTCLAQGFSDDEVKNEAFSAAGAYVELSSYPAEAYEEASALAKNFLDKKYVSKEGNRKLTIMKCIDLSRSDALAKIAQKYSAP